MALARETDEIGDLDEAVAAYFHDGPRSEPIVDDPHPLYDALRSRAPVYRAETGVWLVTGYELCSQLTRTGPWKRELTESGRNTFGADDRDLASTDIFLQISRDHILSRDQPDHTRMRRALSKVFTPRRLELWRDRLTEFAKVRVDAIRDKGQIDFLHDFAWGYPVDALALVVGLPAEGRDLLFQITEVTVRHLSHDFEMTAESVAADNAVLEEYIAWVREVVAHRRANPDGSVLASWIMSVDTGDLSEAELISNIRLMHMAGHETTASLISNAMLCLLRHPDQMELLRSEPDRVPVAIEEVLRYESSANTLMIRAADEDETLGHVTIPAGEGVLGIVGAANRDPTVFEDPHRFDVTRAPNPHIAFGGGMHFCLGAPLARLEAPLAIAEVLRSLRNVSYDEADIHWQRNLTFRTLKTLPISWDPA
jgi:pimeloyl-[acyl-carrier protein] synthase